MHIFPPEPPTPHVGILFAEDFDDLHALSREPQRTEAEHFTPLITAEDVSNARCDGFEAGQRAARAEAAQRLQDAARLSCDRLVELALRLEASREAHLRATIDAAAKLIFAALLSALPSLSERHASQEILHLVRNTITGLSPDEIMTVVVAPDCLAPLQEALDTAPRDIAKRIKLDSDDAMAAGDARLTWQGGAASRQAALAEQALGDILCSLDLLPSAARPDNAQSIAAPPLASPRLKPIADLASPHLETTHG